MLSLTTLLLATSVLAAAPGPLHHFAARQSASSTNSTTNSTTPALPSVTALLTSSNTTLIGNYYASYGIDQFLGIPFAQPPIGALRFSAPVAYNRTGGNLTARTETPACLQDPLGSLAGVNGISEDCLTLNVYAPHRSNTTTTSLPVYVWIYGGGFQSGAASTYNGIPIVAQSIAMYTPVVFVAINYRLGVWGWCQGAECQSNNATNLGLADQILGLQWVQKNIASFGGDPNKVTVVGESAGAISIALHMLNPALLPSTSVNTSAPVVVNSTANATMNLFRGAIMESGAASTYPLTYANISRQSIFTQIANLTGCTRNVTLLSSSNSSFVMYSAAYNQSLFNCVKYANNVTLYNATITLLRAPENQYGNFIFGPTIDGRAVPASPAALVNAGKFLKVPFISGNNKDEGTIFAPPTLNSSVAVAAFTDVVLPSAPNATVLSTLQSYYPDAAAGSPFGTGNNTFGFSEYYKISAAIFSDVSFQAPRRNFLAVAKKQNVTTYSYFFNETLNPASPYGVAHGSEVTYVFGAAALTPTATNATIALTRQMVAYWVNFVNALNPNGNATSLYTPLVKATLNLTTWPTYSEGAGLNMLQLQSNNLTVIQDNYREGAMYYINSVPEALDH